MTANRLIRTAATLLTLGLAQQAGRFTPEEPPTILTRECSRSGYQRTCVDLSHVAILDANWRWLHRNEDYRNCYDYGRWEPSLCSNADECARSCALEGVSLQKYADTYGVFPIERGIELQYVTGSNVGTRLYLARGAEYSTLRLKNREISVQVDVSELPCGLNAALYLVQMDAKGGLGQGANRAGASYGTGYGDAQCPTDVKFVGGRANFGTTGSCATEIDLVEANSQALAWTLHPCSQEGSCEGAACAAYCDRPGADANSYRQGYRTFYGPGMELDSLRPFTAVTQFLTNDGTDAGELVEVRRLYVQDGKLITPPTPAYSITDASAALQKREFGEENQFATQGGVASLGRALDRGLVLVFSIWDDASTGMQWLDSVFPKGSTAPGSIRGPCDPSQTKTVAELRGAYGSARARFTQVSFGDINSTWPVDSFLKACGSS